MWRVAVCIGEFRCCRSLSRALSVVGRRKHVNVFQLQRVQRLVRHVAHLVGLEVVAVFVTWGLFCFGGGKQMKIIK